MCDNTFIHKPQRWNVGMIRDSMIYIGPISSIYDFLTFFALLKIFKCFGTALSHTGWFVESLATQTLVIFIIRTAGNPFHSRPSLALTAYDNRSRLGGYCDPVHVIGKDFGIYAFATRFLYIPWCSVRGPICCWLNW